MIIDIKKIESIKKNLFYRSINSIDDYYNFDWHNYKGEIDTDKINSSQALVIDFWGCIKLSPYKNQLINLFFNKNDDNWEIIFEYKNKSLLSEKRPTQIDLIVESEACAIIIESKFTEQDGGGCSQTNKTKQGFYQCNGKYEEQINPINNIKSKCALTGKGIKYWDYIDALTDFEKDKDYNPCPFKGGEYQWMRNICFAKAYAKHKISECYLVYYKSEKCPISKNVNNGTYLGKLKGKIKDKKSFQPISYNELLGKAISYLDFDDVEKQIWVDLQKWIKNKEIRIN